MSRHPVDEQDENKQPPCRVGSLRPISGPFHLQSPSQLYLGLGAPYLPIAFASSHFLMSGQPNSAASSTPAQFIQADELAQSIVKFVQCLLVKVNHFFWLHRNSRPFGVVNEFEGAHTQDQMGQLAGSSNK